MKNIIMVLTIGFIVYDVMGAIFGFVLALKGNHDFAPWFKRFDTGVNDFLDLIFIVTMFRLNAIEIYLSPANDTPEKISKKLWLLNCLRRFYFIFKLSLSAVWTYIDDDQIGGGVDN